MHFDKNGIGGVYSSGRRIRLCLHIPIQIDIAIEIGIEIGI
jgi:hypothetical protein